jgi:signal transduction histidine kinase
VGRLVLGARRDESRSDARLVADVARHLAAAALAVRRADDLRHSRERIVAAREEERRRLRRDLHDGLGPALAGIDMQLAGARALLASRPDAARAALGDVARDASATVADVRRLVNGLRPPALDDLGLAFAIREQAERLSRPTDGHPLDVEVTVEGDLRGLPAAVEVAAFRIAQEALVNVARHADATRCSVRLSRNGALELVVEDDGGGLATAARAGVGLVSMRERAAELGGTLQVAPRPARGTVVRALLPVNDRPEES